MGEQSVLHRKTVVARTDFDTREMTPAKALRLSLAKAADRLYSLALAVRTVEQDKLSQKDIAGEAGDEGLLVLLDSHAGALAALALDLPFLSALIEVQLKGEIAPGDVQARRVTPTDAAMVSLFVDALMGGFDAALADADPDHVPFSFRFGDRMEDGRSLALALEDPEYDLFRLMVDLGPGARNGTMRLFLPRQPASPRSAQDGKAAGTPARIEETAMNAPVLLDAVLGRISMPFHQICAWQPDIVVDLPPDVLDRAELMAARTHLVARVKLGQFNGFRAVRFTGDAAHRAAPAGAVAGDQRDEGQEPETDSIAPPDEIPVQGTTTIEGEAGPASPTEDRVLSAQAQVEAPVPALAALPAEPG